MRISILIFSLIFFSGFAMSECNIQAISVKNVNGKFVDKCNSAHKPCWFMGGVGVIENSCEIPVGVQVKITAYDKLNSPVNTHEFWPASIRNIPKGEYVFSMPSNFEYSPEISSFRFEVIE
ncbi:hypothetical protein, partial [Pseudoalteromonas sp. SR41-4]|uniref:hypothetical protein n=1 Tax=Pseudoalteromonas sp. SR41-4 TaxID=2760950 RepID=UPI001601C153